MNNSDTNNEDFQNIKVLNPPTLKPIAFLNCCSNRHQHHWSIVTFCTLVLLSTLLANSKSITDAQANIPLTTVDTLRIASLINHQPDQKYPPDFPANSYNQGYTHKEPTTFLPASTKTTDIIPLSQISINSLSNNEKNEIHKVKVRDGDTLAKIFKRLNIPSASLHTIRSTNSHPKPLISFKSGDQLEVEVNRDQQLVRLLIPTSYAESVEYSLVNSKYVSRIIKKAVETDQKIARGFIENSFYVAAQKAGLSDPMIMELVEIFTWDIDFREDIKRGDHFEVVYEQKKLSQQLISRKILAARFTTQGRQITAIAFTDSKGETRFYSPHGMGVKKPFKRNPVDFARISSHFNLKRFHPVLHTIRAHKGVDYAAKTGTPVKATGDGKVIFAGRKGGYGNTVVIQHGQNITTLYGHLNKFAPNIKAGTLVQQDQIIGQVGSSGLATGPHLHYEFMVKGVNKNPLTVSLAVSEPIKTQQQLAFRQTARELLAALDNGVVTPNSLAQLKK